jgi:hypothetical protein
MSVAEYEEAMSNFYDYSQKTQREYWEAQNFEDQRGDV